MKTTLNSRALIVGLMLLAGFCRAGNITYQVDQTGIGPDSVTGTIETDGVIGVVAFSDILDWDLQLFNGTATYNLLGPLSGDNSNLQLLGNALTGSATQLLFDFSAVAGEVLISANGTGLPYWQLDAPSSVQAVAALTLSDEPESGTQVIGTATPEPSTYGFVLIGLLGLMRKRLAR